MNTLELVAAELKALDESRPRSQQVVPGASQAGSCRAALLFRTSGAMTTDSRLNLATLVGTAVHAMCESAADRDTHLVEQKFTYRSIPATIDRYDTKRFVLSDIKTKGTPSKVEDERRRGRPEKRYLWQIMLGAAALIEAGYPVEQVELLYVPRSGGTIDDCWLWSAPFDQGLADEAADWMQAERERAEQLARPATADDVHGLRDEGFFFCSVACEYLTLCRGVQPEPSEDDLSDAAGRLAGAKAREAAAKAEKTEATKELFGFTGTAGPWKVRTVADTSTVRLDIEAVEAKADEWRFVTGEDLPMKESIRRGYVTVSKARA